MIRAHRYHITGVITNIKKKKQRFAKKTSLFSVNRSLDFVEPATARQCLRASSRHCSRLLAAFTRHLFGFKFLDLFEELADDVGTVVGMGLAITLDGITENGVAGDHKEH